MALLRSKGRVGAGVRLSLAIALGFPLNGAGPGQEIDEYQLKAVCLYNFAKFVEWPPEAFKSPGDPIVICILGESPLGVALGQAVNGKAIEDRGFVIRHVPAARQATGCQILFVSSSERRRIRSILGEIGNGGILTVGEADGFASDGGVVNFKLENGRVRLQINVAAAERERLRISSKLLRLAEIVKDAPR